MKLKLFLVVTLSVFACSLNACPDTSLSHQYETGALQWQIVRKEIDPNTLIHQAILENASEEIINFLLSHGVNVDYPDQNGMSPLTMAVLNRSTNAVKLLLDKGANPNPMVKWNSMSLLELALSMKDADSSRLLVEHGANVNARNKNESVLTQVIRLTFTESTSSQWVGIAELMISKGANVNSCENNDSPISGAIWLAIRKNDISFLEYLLKKGADVNVVLKHQGKEWNTPLLIAVGYGNLTLIKFLVDSEADVNKSINYGGVEIRSPLKHALDLQKPEIVQYLMQHGARA